MQSSVRNLYKLPPTQGLSVLTYKYHEFYNFFPVSSSVLEASSFRPLLLARQRFAPPAAWEGITCTLRGEEDEVERRGEHLLCTCPRNQTLGVGRMRSQPGGVAYRFSSVLSSFGCC